MLALRCNLCGRINESAGTRTQDLRLKRPLLYQLSYTPRCSKGFTIEILPPGVNDICWWKPYDRPVGYHKRLQNAKVTNR